MSLAARSARRTVCRIYLVDRKGKTAKCDLSLAGLDWLDRRCLRLLCLLHRQFGSFLLCLCAKPFGLIVKGFDALLFRRFGSGLLGHIATDRRHTPSPVQMFRCLLCVRGGFREDQCAKRTNARNVGRHLKRSVSAVDFVKSHALI